MYRIRFHGRGGQGMKTASRILGKAFFKEGFEVQDAPRYGAERRGAPMFAYVRASHDPINERGIIKRPDCVVVVDDTLIPVPSAGILQGCDRQTLLLIKSDIPAEEWTDKLSLEGPVLCLPEIKETGKSALLGGMVCVGATARLLQVLSREAFEVGLREELAHLGKEVVESNVLVALEAFDRLSDSPFLIREGTDISAQSYESPQWIDLQNDNSSEAAPAIYAEATSEKMKTGLWRTMRPVIDHKICNRCWWLCSTFCPEGAIHLDEERFPQIDYAHCKGCLICMGQCPTHAISSIPEQEASQTTGEDSK